MTPGASGSILADTSVWVDHVRRGNEDLAAALDAGVVLVHDFILGELMIGALARARVAMRDVESLPRAPRASHEEVVTLVRTHRLEGSGIGWIDAHLLASAMLRDARVLTLDKALVRAARRLRIA